MDRLQLKNELGRTGIQVPPIIFGTSALGNLYRALDEKTKLEIIGNWFRWIEPPVVIDTAGKYGAGLALEVIGDGLRKLQVPTENIMISNKLGWYRTELKTKEPTFEPGVWMDLKYDAVQRISYDGIMECYEQGLELLGGGYQTEILSVHDPDEYLNEANSSLAKSKRMEDIRGAYNALEDLKRQGKAKAIGVGAKDWKVIREISGMVDLDWVMLATSYTIREQPAELIKFMNELTERKISIINSAVFHGGFLTGSDYYNYRKLDPKAENDRPLYEWRKSFYEICNRYEVKPSDACIKYGMSHPGIIGIALNTSRPEAIGDNVRLMQQSLPDLFWSDLAHAGLIDRNLSIK